MSEITRHALEYAAVKVASRNDRSRALWQLDRVQNVTLQHTSPLENIREATRPGTIVGREPRMPDAGGSLTWLAHANIAAYAALAGLDPDAETEVLLSDYRQAHCDLILPIKDDAGTIVRTDYLLDAYMSGLTIDCRGADSNIVVDVGFEAAYYMAALASNPYVIVYEHTVTAGEEAAGEFDIDADYPAPVEFDTDAGGHFFASHYIDDSASKTVKVNEGALKDFTLAVRTVTSDALAEDDVWVFHYAAASFPVGVTDTFDSVNDTDPAEVPATKVTLYLRESDTDHELARIESARISLGQTREKLAQIGDRYAYARGLTDESITVELGRIDTDRRMLIQLQDRAIATAKILDPLDFDVSGIDFEMRVYTTVGKDTLALRYIVSNVVPQNFDLRSGDVLTAFRSGSTLVGTNLRITNLAVGS